MSGTKYKSGDLPRKLKVNNRGGNYPRTWRITTEDRAKLVVDRMLRDNTIPAIERARLALPIYLKTMTSKQAVVSLTASLELNSNQVDQLVAASSRNSLIYKDLEQRERSPGQSGAESESGGGVHP